MSNIAPQSRHNADDLDYWLKLVAARTMSCNMKLEYSS